MPFLLNLVAAIVLGLVAIFGNIVAILVIVATWSSVFETRKYLYFTSPVALRIARLKLFCIEVAPSGQSCPLSKGIFRSIYGTV